MSSFDTPHEYYLFDLDNGKKKLAWGPSPEEALTILSYRLSEKEMARLNPVKFRVVHQRDLQKFIGMLG